MPESSPWCAGPTGAPTVPAVGAVRSAPPGPVPHDPGAVAAALLSAAAAFRSALAAFDPAGVPAAARVGVVEALAATEKACATARVRTAALATSSGAHRQAGFRDPADWLAAVTGSSAGEAKAALGTAGALDACPVTREALVAGELSLAQAAEITRAEAERPGVEASLVALARRSSLTMLRDEARRRRFAAADAEVLHARQRAARSVRHWRDDLGMVCGRFALPPDVGVPFVHRLDAGTDRIRRAARRSGSTEPREAHAADALADLVDHTDACADLVGDVGDGAKLVDHAAGGESRDGTVVADPAAGGRRVSRSRRRRGASADLVIVCDLRAWRRGHAHAGEPCHIVGGTPVPVAVARRVAAEHDAFLKAVVHDGRRVDTVVHWGRHVPAEVRTALELGSPPGFDGAVCVEVGCGRRHGLEWDHVDPLANRGPTAYANLAARCWPHHRDKTDRDRAAGLLGPVHRARRPGHDPP